MKASDERILATHVGSLPRKRLLTDLLLARERGAEIDLRALKDHVETAVKDVVRAQIEAGVDVINDGEQPRTGFSTHVVDRVSGFSGQSSRPQATDYKRFPGFAEYWKWMFRGIPAHSHGQPQATGAVHYHGIAAIETDCRLLLQCLKEVRSVEGFLTSPSPGIIATTMENAFYETHERYVFALAAALKHEYETIVRSGLVLQIDAPDLAMERNVLYQDATEKEFLRIVELHIAALNHALTGIPADKVRLHVCWGAWGRPHFDDIALRTILPIILQARVGALSIGFASPRHQHEYAVFRDIRLPDDMLLIAGVIDNTTNIVEHPQVVANRIYEAVAAVGDRSRVIAGTDCGFGTFAGFEQVAHDVAFAKLQSCREGADIASSRLWGRTMGPRQAR